MSLKIENLHFFNKKGTNLNLYYDSFSGLYRGNYVLSEQPVSIELIESEQIIILEKVFSEQYNKFMYVKPTNTANDNSKITFEIDINSTNFFTFDITLDEDNFYYIDKGTTQSVSTTNDVTFSDVVINTTNYTNIPSSYNIDELRQGYETINIGFSASQENSYIGKIFIYNENDTSKTKIGEINLFVDVVDEDTRLPLLLDTLGYNINNKDYLIFDTTDVKEEEIDFSVMNKKRKELLLEFHNIFPYLGSYKALINIIKFFGYESLSIKEYWKNVKVDSENFGKKRPVDVESVLLNSNNIEELADLFPSKVYKKTNEFGLYYQITEPTGEFDEDGLPITKETFQFTIDEILIKLFALKDKLKKYFLPFNSRIVDIVGEALYFSKIELNYWQSINRIDDVDINIKPTFEVSPNKYGFISDLRPLEWVGAKIGPDLLLDESTNLSVREFTLTNSFYGNTLKIFDSVSGIGYEIIAEYQSTDESNMRRLYEGLINLGGIFDNLYINLDGNKILFVERFETNINLVSFVEQGQFAGVVPSLTSTDYFNGDQPVDNYGNAYLEYFFDRDFNVNNLNNNEDIPVGYPIILKNTSFEVTWDDAQITWNSLDENSNYNNFIFSSDSGFPTLAYNNGDDPFSGVSWDEFGNANFYELTWLIYKEETEDSPYWENTITGSLSTLKEWFVILPYSGNYNVELTIHDLYGSYSKTSKENYIVVEQKNPNFTAWKFKDLNDITWEDLEELSWDNMNSTWDLPFLPNTTFDDAIVTWHSLDRIEFYQNLLYQDSVLRSKGDVNSYTWDNLDDDTTWDDLDHLWWDELSPTFTKFYITELVDTTSFGLTIKNEFGNELENITFNRNNDVDNVYIDFIDQVSSIDSEIYPITSSFIYEYRPIISFGATTIEQIVGISKEYEKPLRYYFEGDNLEVSEYNTPLNGFGAIGDTTSSFDIYSSINIQNFGVTGATAIESSITINDITYDVPTNIDTLSDLADDLNNNSPFNGWEFNIVQAYQGATADLLDVKILAYNKYESNEVNIIDYENIFGNKYARSVTTNATWNSLDVLYYQRDVKPFTQIYFNYDISKMPGFTKPKWVITKTETGEVVFEWLNKYMVYLFSEEGEYDISLELQDTNANTKSIKKNGLVRVIKE